MARRDWTGETLVAGIRAGDRRALARAITLVENADPLSYELVRELYPETGHAYAVGVTGPPGVGKSTLVGALLRHVRARGLTAGVISVDPSSPFSKGALLGDRIRLADHFLDPEVFIRSMGARGHLGGLAEGTLQALLLLDAFGKEFAKTGTISGEYHRFLMDAQEARNTGDYQVFSHLTGEETVQHITHAEHFLEMGEKLLRENPHASSSVSS